MGAKVRAFDPAGMHQAKALLNDVTYCDSPYSCADAADAIVVVTEWEQFRALDLERLRDLMACPVIVDLRKRIPGRRNASHGFVYSCVGKRPAAPIVESGSYEQLLWAMRPPLPTS